MGIGIVVSVLAASVARADDACMQRCDQHACMAACCTQKGDDVRVRGDRCIVEPPCFDKCKAETEQCVAACRAQAQRPTPVEDDDPPPETAAQARARQVREAAERKAAERAAAEHRKKLLDSFQRKPGAPPIKRDPIVVAQKTACLSGDAAACAALAAEKRRLADEQQDSQDEKLRLAADAKRRAEEAKRNRPPEKQRALDACLAHRATFVRGIQTNGFRALAQGFQNLLAAAHRCVNEPWASCMFGPHMGPFWGVEDRAQREHDDLFRRFNQPDIHIGGSADVCLDQPVTGTRGDCETDATTERLVCKARLEQDIKQMECDEAMLPKVWAAEYAVHDAAQQATHDAACHAQYD